MLVFAAIAPHGGPVFDDPEGATRKGMEELGRRFDAARPEAVIVLTPHGIHLDDHFAVVRSVRLAGDVAEWSDSGAAYDGPGDPALAEACIAALHADELPALGLTFGATAAGASTMPLDWGALIPLWFMGAPAVVVSPCRARRNDEHVRAGA
ncbi:MAG: extradiol ring-cleavage dioxygenase, partial [Actinobacteria bacterium]|nr:extradiol ring-cleavage dioxygenase [Actinomycetota bacterium]